MCVIVVKPSRSEITDQRMQQLKRCFQNNPDGAGLMFPTGSMVQIVKGFMEFEELRWWIDKRADLLASRQVVFHFRYATHGTVCEENCHPFPLSHDAMELNSIATLADVAFVHNGVIPGLFDPMGIDSDTCLFADRYLADVGNDVFQRRVRKWLHKEVPFNKFVFMSNTRLLLVGEFERDGNWRFSNRDYRILNLFQGIGQWEMDEWALYDRCGEATVGQVGCTDLPNGIDLWVVTSCVICERETLALSTVDSPTCPDCQAAWRDW